MKRTVWPAPDRSRLVVADDVRVYVTDVGPEDGRAVVFLHDVLRCGHAFAGVLDHVSHERRSVVVDLPGCGESDRPEHAERHRIEWLAEIVARALAELGISRCDVVGAGFGGLVAMALATAHPALVERVIGIGVPRGDGQYVHEMRLASLPGIGHLAFARAYRRSDLERTLRRSLVDPRALDGVTADVYWDRLGREGGIAAARDMLLQLERAPAIGDAFAACDVPVLLVWGERDPVGVLDRERWAEVVPRAQTGVIEGSGQAAAEDRPDLVAALLDQPRERG
jgi:pimeloyl-ACP methyl ester carboxylesterase